jgi:hypothetical protein
MTTGASHDALAASAAVHVAADGSAGTSKLHTPPCASAHVDALAATQRSATEKSKLTTALPHVSDGGIANHCVAALDDVPQLLVGAVLLELD